MQVSEGICITTSLRSLVESNTDDIMVPFAKKRLQQLSEFTQITSQATTAADRTIMAEGGMGLYNKPRETYTVRIDL